MADAVELGDLRLTKEERSGLEQLCPYFPSEYLDYLAGLVLKPQEQVKLDFIPKDEDLGEITCVIEGLWKEVILYEVPILSISKRNGFINVCVDSCSERGLFPAYRY